MKRMVFVAAVMSVILQLQSCSYLEQDTEAEKVSVRLNFNYDAYENVSGKSVAGEIPDTAMFVLKVISASGGSVYDGLYRDKPEEFELEKGNYTFSVISSLKTMPEFSLPVFGDVQDVYADRDLSVSFMCRQQNAAVRIVTGPDIEKAFPYGYFNIRTSGSDIRYGYHEDRFLFVDPGEFIIEFVKAANSRVELLRRYVSSSEMTTFIAGTGSSGGNGDIAEGIRIVMDTSRIWSSDYLDMSDIDNKGKAVPVSSLASMIGQEDVWVYGYIAGGDLSSSSVRTSPPFKSMSNLAIAASPGEKNRARMVSVELPSGEIRDALNLVENPSNLGKKVYLRGDVSESYFSLTGLKKTDRFEW